MNRIIRNNLHTNRKAEASPLGHKHKKKHFKAIPDIWSGSGLGSSTLGLSFLLLNPAYSLFIFLMNGYSYRNETYSRALSREYVRSRVRSIAGELIRSGRESSRHFRISLV